MNRIILASHSNLAKGMYDSLKFFNNDIEDSISYICAYEDGLNFENTLRETLDHIDGENILVFTDIIGGSINQTAVKFLKSYPIHVISGMNLPMLLSVVFAPEEINDKNIGAYITQGKDQIVYMNPYMADLDEAHDD